MQDPLCNDEQLAKKDEQADKAIANRSLSALMVNVLPPPLVHRALGKVVFEMGEDLSEIYDVEKDTKLFKDMAGAMVDDLTEAYKSQPDETQCHLDNLKYIPGVNIWVGMMMQQHTATAVTKSVGYAFKCYFHAQVENRTVEPQEVAQIAADLFRQTLTRG